MLIKIKHRFILTLCLFLLSACSFTATDSTPTQPTAEFIIEGLCDNLLYPVKQNATWTYSVTGSPNGNFNYTETITQITPVGFIVTSQINDSTQTQNWSCETGGLKALQLGALNYLTSPSATLEVTGINLPKELISGMQWLYSLKLEQGTYTIIMQEMGSEAITVPAGVLNAIKFQATHQFESSDAQLNFSSASTVWYAQNIGFIKSIDDVQKNDGAFTVTTELISYNIP